MTNRFLGNAVSFGLGLGVVVFGVAVDRGLAGETKTKSDSIPEALCTLWVCDQYDRTYRWLDRSQERFLITPEKVFHQSLEASLGTEIVSMEFDIAGHIGDKGKRGTLLLKPISKEKGTIRVTERGVAVKGSEPVMPEFYWELSYSFLGDSAATLYCLPAERLGQARADERFIKRRWTSIHEAEARHDVEDARPARKAADDIEAFYNLAELRRLHRKLRKFKVGDSKDTRDALVKGIFDSFEKHFAESIKSNSNGLAVSPAAWSLAYRAVLLEKGYDPLFSTNSLVQSSVEKSIPEGIGGEAMLYFIESEDQGSDGAFKIADFQKRAKAVFDPFETGLREIVADSGAPESLPPLFEEK